MAYSQTDPRSRLATASAPSPPAAGAAGYGTPSYAKFYETAPQLRADDASTWLVRGQNFVLAYSEVGPGATLERPAQDDEYALLIPDLGPSVEVTWAQELALSLETRIARLYLATNPSARSAALITRNLDPLTGELEQLSRWMQPNRVYSYCFCAIK